MKSFPRISFSFYIYPHPFQLVYNARDYSDGVAWDEQRPALDHPWAMVQSGIVFENSRAIVVIGNNKPNRHER